MMNSYHYEKAGAPYSISLLMLVSLLCLLFVGDLYAADNVISVNVGNELGQVNKKVFGNNFRVMDPVHQKPLYYISDFGLGVWDPLRKEPFEPVADLAREAGLTVVRYAMGNRWDWKSAIGKNRKHLLFGVDEFMKTMEVINAEAVFTVSPTIGDEMDAADFVEYLNSPNDGSNPGGGKDWAAERAENGHPLPYKVKYFEIGNETYGSYSRIVSDVEYVDIYLRFYEQMKRIDPSIMVGLVLPAGTGHYWISKGRILPRVKDKLDFFILHFYYNPDWWNLGEKVNSPEAAYEMLLSIPDLVTKNMIQNFLNVTSKESGKNVPLAITEYNSWAPYHVSLGSALFNAELLKTFMKPQNNVLMANHWHFSNGMYAMIQSKDWYQSNYRKKPAKYRLTPNYYMYELYNKHFGDILIDTEVKSAVYDIGKNANYVKKLKEQRFYTPKLHIPYLSVNASKSESGDKVYLMVINKNMDEAMKTLIEINGTATTETAQVWILNGSSVDADNFKTGKVQVKHEIVKLKGNSFEFMFEPHSLTAIEIRTKK